MQGVFNLGVNQNITYFQHTFVRVKLSSETHVYIPAEYNNFDRRIHSIGQHAVILTLKNFFFPDKLTQLFYQLFYKPTMSEPQRAIILADVLSNDKMQVLLIPKITHLYV